MTAAAENNNSTTVPTIEIDPASPSPVTDRPISPFNINEEPNITNGAPNGDAEKSAMHKTSTNEAEVEAEEPHQHHP